MKFHLMKVYKNNKRKRRNANPKNQSRQKLRKSIKTHSVTSENDFYDQYQIQDHSLQYKSLNQVLFRVDKLFQVNIPPHNSFRGVLQFLQKEVSFVLLAASKELAGVFRIVRHQQIEKCRKGPCFNFMYIESMGLDGRDGGVRVVFQLLISEPFLRICVDIEPRILQKMIIQCRDIYLPVDAFGNAGHLGVAVPVEFESIGY